MEIHIDIVSANVRRHRYNWSSTIKLSDKGSR